MASFQIHQDMSNKENPGIKIPAGGKNAKQPLAVIGGKAEKNALAPRANFAVLNGNNNVPRPTGKVVSTVADFPYIQCLIPMQLPFYIFMVVGSSHHCARAHV